MGQLRIGLITGSEIATNREGEDNVRLLQVQITDTDDVQTVEQIRGSGDDSNPQDDSAAIIADLGSAWKIAVGIDDGVDPGTIAKGERKIYSYDAARAIKAFIHWLVDGTLVLNDDTDNAVRYSVLETAFNQLKADHDALVNVMNLHSHWVTAPGAVTSLPVTPPPEYTPAAPPGGVPGVMPSTADISDAKIDNIKVPGTSPGE